jgi:hypothetical protein
MFGFEGDNAREKVIVLLTMCFALAMAMLDNTVVNVALPSIKNDLGAGFSQLQWIVDAYVLAFASLLLTGGILGDRYGRKKMFLTGVAVFTPFSVPLRVSQTPGSPRLPLPSVGGALLLPGTSRSSRDVPCSTSGRRPRDLGGACRDRARSLDRRLRQAWSEHIGWESAFFLNVPIVVAFIVATDGRQGVDLRPSDSLDVTGSSGEPRPLRDLRLDEANQLS